MTTVPNVCATNRAHPAWDAVRPVAPACAPAVPAAEADWTPSRVSFNTGGRWLAYGMLAGVLVLALLGLQG